MLTAVVLVNASIVGAWVYLEPLGAQARIPHGVVALATPLSLAMQILGAACATVLAGRAPWFLALMVSVLVLIGATLALALLPGAGVFLALEAVVGFAWLFILPYFTTPGHRDGLDTTHRPPGQRRKLGWLCARAPSA